MLEDASDDCRILYRRNDPHRPAFTLRHLGHSKGYSFATFSDERGDAEFIGQIPVVDLTPEIKTLTIVLRQEKKSKLPDAIVVATADAAQAIMIANDNQLAHASGVRYMPPSLRT